MRRNVKGFTIIELLVTLTLVGIVAMAALPLATIMETRAKETELRRSLRVIRQALDNYKLASDSGAIDKATGASGYPPSLSVLAQGVTQSVTFGISKTPIVFLRNIPRDPFNTDKTLKAEETWNIRPYGAPSDRFGGKDVFDINSKSEKTALDGTKYSDW